MTKITIRDTRGSCTYECSFHASARQRILRYVESSDGDDYIVYLDGYSIGGLNDEEFDEFKGLFRLRFRKHEDVSLEEYEAPNPEIQQDISDKISSSEPDKEFDRYYSPNVNLLEEEREEPHFLREESSSDW